MGRTGRRPRVRAAGEEASCWCAARRSSPATGSGRPPPPRRFDDGWFRTGDLAAADDDGYLAIRGRPTDSSSAAGFNVYPAEVEDVLLGPPGRGRGGGDRDALGRVGRDGGGLGGAGVRAVWPSTTCWPSPPSGWPPTNGPDRCDWSTSLPRNAMGKLQRGELR